MHWSLILLLSSLLAAGQASPPQSQNAQVAPSAASPHADEASLTIPAGTKVPLALKQAISTKNAHEGDAVHAAKHHHHGARERDVHFEIVVWYTPAHLFVAFLF